MNCPNCGHVIPPKQRKAKAHKLTMKDIQGHTGPFAKGVANMRAGGAVNLYLAATGKDKVPAHDPAFGKVAA